MISESRYRELIKIVNDARPLYMNGEETGISDDIYDSYMAQIYEYEQMHGAAEGSPTQSVNPSSDTATVVHPVPMLSLLDVFSIEDAANFALEKKVPFCIEDKMDGLSVQLIYKDGILKSAATRGDGHYGESIMANVRFIHDIPQVLEHCPFSIVIVRGEIYMTKSKFKAYTEKYGPAANARNTAAGLAKRKNELERCEYLSFRAFNFEDAAVAGFDSHASALDYLNKAWNIPIVRSAFFETPEFDTIDQFIKKANETRESLDYPIDGLVVKLDKLSLRAELGDNGVVPRWAVAYKFPAKERETRLLRIDFQVGSTGKLTPVAILDPVPVDGSTITRCTLHNRKRIEDLDLQINDMVVIFKSGDIIPAIKSARHTPESTPVVFPTVCPACGSSLVHDSCDNIECPEKLKARLNAWVGKSIANFKGVAGSLIDALFERGVVKTPADFYTKVTPATFLTIPKVGTAKKNTYFQRVNESKKNLTFTQFLVGIGIDGLSYAGAEKLTNHFKASSIPSWKEAAAMLLSMPEGVFIDLLGAAKGSSTYRQLQVPFMIQLVKDLSGVFEQRTL